MDTEQQLRLDPVVMDGPVIWLAFSPESEDGYINVRFMQRFGAFPAEIRRVANLKLAGPITANPPPNLQTPVANKSERGKNGYENRH